MTFGLCINLVGHWGVSNVASFSWAVFINRFLFGSNNISRLLRFQEMENNEGMGSMTNYKILEILELEPVSKRLSNAVNSAYQLGDMPCNTVQEYRQSKEEMINRLHKLPNIGKKSIHELISLLDKYSHSIPGQVSLVSSELSIPNVLKSVSIVTYLKSLSCSVRLENALIDAIEKNDFSYKILGDLDGENVYVLKNKLHKVKNLGGKSIEEFIGFLKEISPDSTKSMDCKTDCRTGFNLQTNTIDWASDYLSLLEEECYRDITVTEIVRKIPGLSKIERQLLKALDQEYNDTPLFRVLASSSGNLDEISRTIINDEKLSFQLASLIMDFYRFLSSKRKNKFSYEEYFENDFSSLNEKESKILLSRFGVDKLTLVELGMEFGVSRERVRQIESKALKKYIKMNRVELLNLSENLEKHVKASKGVISIDTVKELHRISRRKLEIVLNIIVVPENGGSCLLRDGEYIINSDFKGRQTKIFSEIERFIYLQAGYAGKVNFYEIDGVNSQVLSYFFFVNHRKFSMNADGEINIVIRSASERARIVLTIAGQPIHTSEAVRLYKILFKEDITEHALGATLNRLPDGLIVGPGKYALYSHLRLSTEDIDSIRDEAYELIQSACYYLSSRIIFEHIYKIKPDFRLKEPYFNHYLVLGVLQDDERYQIKRGFMVGMAGFEDHLPLETEVEVLVEKHGPVSVPEIMELLRPTRGELTNGSVRNILIASNEIFLTSEQRKWDVAERVFNDTSDIRKLQIAIRLAAYNEKIALSSVYNRIRSTGVIYGIGTILSVMWKDPEIKRHGDYIGFFGTDAEIERYYATGEPTTLSQLNYRYFSEKRAIDTGILDALVKEFDLDV
ncbi:sigma factor-like helix-turn-helix DNA-binding protein [Halomonas sp. KRD171]|uniref:sigma factor-like helix-turn-helix DNA-binding protein n=1 Tax=Halomonas sp. KRD171 TaxID=2729726 RepID=UPI0019D13479|nr:sigma factor-like helix-turn-helix DNA-binding protein [Halomonas sp. KRD171]